MEHYAANFMFAWFVVNGAFSLVALILCDGAKTYSAGVIRFERIVSICAAAVFSYWLYPAT